MSAELAGCASSERLESDRAAQDIYLLPLVLIKQFLLHLISWELLFLVLSRTFAHVFAHYNLHPN